MLTLTRRLGERIVIGDDVVVEVVQIQGGRVRLGIKAPRSLPVYRGELLEKIEGENLRARAARSARSWQPPPDTPVLEFPKGLFGMPELKRWVLCELDDVVEHATEAGQVRVLLSVDDSSIRLLVVDLCELDPSYPSAMACDAAGVSSQAAIAGIVTAPADGSEITVNSIAPLVIDLETLRGCQVILTHDGLSVRQAVANVAEVA